MIIGTLMVLETCLILGQVSHNFLYWKKNLLTDTCGPGENDKTAVNIHAKSFVQSFWRLMGKHTKLMLKKYEGSISSTLKTRNLMKLPRMLERNQWFLSCFARETRKESMWRSVTKQ